MDAVNKTLFIPLYGKAYVSDKGIILKDIKASEIWNREGIALKGKSKSKWLAYYMAMRSAVIDDFVSEQIEKHPNASVLHLGCGLDSRVLRIKKQPMNFYDIDFEDVMNVRKLYYTENNNYHMISSDVRNTSYLTNIPNDFGIIVMEGISMYLKHEEVKRLLLDLSSYFKQCVVIMDVYSEFAAKMSKYKNPINEVGVTEVYGIDEPKSLENNSLKFTTQLEMTPIKYINQLSGMEKNIFKKLYAGKFSKNLYKLYIYEGK